METKVLSPPLTDPVPEDDTKDIIKETDLTVDPEKPSKENNVFISKLVRCDFTLFIGISFSLVTFSIIVNWTGAFFLCYVYCIF